MLQGRWEVNFVENKNSKVIAIAALLVAVVGLSIGFAAFSNTLKISSGATVTPDSDTFKVRFSSKSDSLDASAVAGSAVTGEGYEAGATATAATIDNDATEQVGDATVTVPKITNLKAQFTKPGQAVKYTFYARNEGEYVAYLNSITFGEKACAAVEGGGADATKVTAACGDITLTVSVGGTNYTSTNDAITAQTIAVGGNHEIIVTIDYAKGNSPVDGPFTVTFDDVALVYSSVD